MLDHENIIEKTNATVIYKLKDYDLLGPEDFHSDRSLDKWRTDNWNRPWLSI